jgi:hypothetical protein
VNNGVLYNVSDVVTANANLTFDGSFLTVGTTLILASGSIFDTGGTINFATNDLTTTGNITVGGYITWTQPATGQFEWSMDNAFPGTDTLILQNPGATKTRFDMWANAYDEKCIFGVFSKFSSITDYSGLRFRALEASTGYHELASVGSAGQRLPINIYVQGFTNQLVLENTGDITMNTGDLSVVNGNVEIGTYLEIANSSFTYSPPGAGHYAFNCGAGAVFNEDGADRDFRIEAVGRPYAFAIDGASGAVAVNLDPAGAGFRFTVNGGTAITGLLKTDAGLRHLIQEVEDSNLTLTGIEYTVLMKATLSSVTITLDADRR